MLGFAMLKLMLGVEPKESFEVKDKHGSITECLLTHDSLLVKLDGSYLSDSGNYVREKILNGILEKVEK